MISQLFSRSIRVIAISALVCGVALLAGCQKKADPAALQRVEKAIAAYQKLVISYGASGFTMEEFRKQTNEAEFLLTDAIKFLKAKGIKEDFLGGEGLTIVAERLANYRTIFNGADEREQLLRAAYREEDITFKSDMASYFTSARHYLPDPACKEIDSGWLTPGPINGLFIEPFGPVVLIELAKKLPELKLSYYDGHLVEMPDNVMKEIREYQHGKQEPKGFLTHFEKYCKESKYGFSYNQERKKYGDKEIFPFYQAELYASLDRVKSAAISEVRKIVDNLDAEIKKIQ